MAERRDTGAVGRWILAWRDKKFTQEQLSTVWHINRTRLGQIEQGNLIPSVEEIERLKREGALSFEEWLGLRGAYFNTTGHLLRVEDSDYSTEVVTPEQQFVAATTNLPTIQIGDLRLPTRLFPAFLWDANRMDHTYTDDGEFTHQIEVVWTESQLPTEVLGQLSREMSDTLRDDLTGTITLPDEQRLALKDTYDIITKERSNPYPRLVRMPEVTNRQQGDEIIHTFHIFIGQGKYGISVIEERKNILPSLPTATALRSQYNLQAFAIRVAYIGQANSLSPQWVEFQQREDTAATWKNAWDVGGAGYVDYQNHRDPKDRTRVSVWQSACDEISKELGIPEEQLPHRDRCHFFGFAKDEPTGHMILLGYSTNDYVPTQNRPSKERVQSYGRCELTPEAIAVFLEKKKHWVPAAVLTLYLMLEAEGFEKERIVRAFSSLEGKLDFDAYEGIV